VVTVARVEVQVAVGVAVRNPDPVVVFGLDFKGDKRLFTDDFLK
jgi:hypothetical protein